MSAIVAAWLRAIIAAIKAGLRGWPLWRVYVHHWSGLDWRALRTPR
jgi:hypothetical protein